jgi:hypothetical protein
MKISLIFTLFPIYLPYTTPSATNPARKSMNFILGL